RHGLQARILGFPVREEMEADMIFAEANSRRKGTARQPVTPGGLVPASKQIAAWPVNFRHSGANAFQAALPVIYHPAPVRLIGRLAGCQLGRMPFLRLPRVVLIPLLDLCAQPLVFLG